VEARPQNPISNTQFFRPGRFDGALARQRRRHQIRTVIGGRFRRSRQRPPVHAPADEFRRAGGAVVVAIGGVGDPYPTGAVARYTVKIVGFTITVHTLYPCVLRCNPSARKSEACAFPSGPSSGVNESMKVRCGRPCT